MWLEAVVAFVSIWLSRVFWRRWKYDLHKIPTPAGWPILGQTLDFFRKDGKRELSLVQGRWYKQLGYPKIMKASILGRTMVYIRDTDCAKNVVMSKTDPIPKIDRKNDKYTICGGDATVDTLVFEQHVTPYAKAVRKIYATAFQSASLKHGMPKLLSVIDQMIAIVETEREKGPVDFQELCVDMTLDTIGQVALDCNLGGMDKSRDLHRLIIEAGYVHVERMFNIVKLWQAKYIPNSSVDKRHKAAFDALTAEWDRITKQILSFPDPPAGKEPLWHCMRSLIRPDTHKKIPYNELRSEIALVIIAGMDTTGHQLAWLLALLASHPRVVDALLHELKEHGLYGERARELAFEDLGELPYLTAIVKEGMRIASISLQSQPRATDKDMTLLGYRIPKGTRLVILGNRWTDSEEEWGDPLVFRPERWLTDEDISKKWYLGFSFGPRDCVGQKLAMMEMRVGIIQLIKKYNLRLSVDIMDLLKNTKNGIAIEAIDGILLDVSPRMPVVI